MGSGVDDVSEVYLRSILHSLVFRELFAVHLSKEEPGSDTSAAIVQNRAPRPNPSIMRSVNKGDVLLLVATSDHPVLTNAPENIATGRL
jgi:hypothetical protein